MICLTCGNISHDTLFHGRTAWRLRPPCLQENHPGHAPERVTLCVVYGACVLIVGAVVGAAHGIIALLVRIIIDCSRVMVPRYSAVPSSAGALFSAVKIARRDLARPTEYYQVLYCTIQG